MLHTLEVEVLLLRNSGDALDGPRAWEDELLCDGSGRDASCRGGCTWLFVAGFDGIVVELDTDSIALSRRLHDRLAGRW